MRSHPNKAVVQTLCPNSRSHLIYSYFLDLPYSAHFHLTHSREPPQRASASRPLPARLLARERDAAARRLLCSPTAGAAIRKAFSLPPPPLASWRSFRLAHSTVARTVVDPYPVRTAPKYSGHFLPAAVAASCHPSW